MQEWIGDCAVALVAAIIIDCILPRNLHLDQLVQVQAGFGQASGLGIVAPEILSGRFGAQASPVGAATMPVSALLAPDSSVLMLGERSNVLAGRLT